MNTCQPRNPTSWQNELYRATMTWDPMDCLSHRSLRAKTSRIHSTWPSLGYVLLSITYYMPILPCSLCMICSFLCLWHAFLTHALHYTWWLILVLVCVFASLVEILLAIAMIALCPCLWWYYDLCARLRIGSCPSNHSPNDVIPLSTTS